MSDAKGNYLITGLPAGTFQVRAEMPGFKSRDGGRTVSLKKGRCSVENFGLWTTNSVEGFIYDQNGAPVPELGVFLQRKGSKDKIGKGTKTNSQGAFRFKEVDPGEHSFVISPEGETADSPYLSTTSPEPIPVGPTSTVHLSARTVPPPIPTRNIRIFVTRADGTPLTEGYLSCSQKEKEAEGYPMSEGLGPKEGGTICRALADRTYHIRLERTTDRDTPQPAHLPEAFVLPSREDTEVHLQLP